MGVFASVESSAFELRESAQQVDGLSSLKGTAAQRRARFESLLTEVFSN
jgi:hypothetical protein